MIKQFQLYDNILNKALVFSDAVGAALKTKQELRAFLLELSALDVEEKSEFELSFKINRNIVNKGEIRILNLDADAYSCKNEIAYLKRLVAYKKMTWSRSHCPSKKKIFNILESFADNHLDLYYGADITHDRFSFAFWLILGGVKPDGTISYATNSLNIFKKALASVSEKPSFKVESKDILNIGYDLEDEAAYFKIYFFLNKKTEQLIEETELEKTKKISDFLGSGRKHWFFASERCIIDKVLPYPKRKKTYLEFLDIVHTADESSYEILKGIFSIIGCPYDIGKLKGQIGKMNARIAIIAFEKDGTVTFYLRI